ncbi:MAG TPA: hypothetical protein VFN48_04095 [Solirubrobacteraceae bacterium]|nr:hypothetical protein [Solirubrobacteraceae bacterium]
MAPTVATPRTDTLMLGAVSASTAILHLSAAQGHWADSRLYGSAFIVTGVIQLLWAAAVSGPGRGSRWLLRAGVGFALLAMAVWLCSRTVGLPLGPDLGHPEAPGVPDVCAVVCEGVLVLLCLRVLRRPGAPLPEWASAVALLSAFVALIVFTAVAHVG